jgi:predicted nucleic acid-binding protein
MAFAAAGEDLLDQANRLAELHARQELQLLAPAFMEAEIGNVLWKAVGRKRITPREAERSLHSFTALAIQMVPISDLLAPALQLAVAYDRSFYDSLHVALALATKTELVTADERMVNALGSRFPVRWLGVF